MPIDFDSVHIENLLDFFNFTFYSPDNVGDLHDVGEVKVLLVEAVGVDLTVLVLGSRFLIYQLPNIFKIYRISEVEITYAQPCILANWYFLRWIFRPSFWIVWRVLARAWISLISPPSRSQILNVLVLGVKLRWTQFKLPLTRLIRLVLLGLLQGLKLVHLLCHLHQKLLIVHVQLPLWIAIYLTQ